MEDMKMVPMNNNKHEMMTANWLPRIFGDFFGDDWNWLYKTTKLTPAVNVCETDKDYKVEVAVPGITKGDCTVRIADNMLCIGVRKQTEETQEQDGKKYLRREFSYSNFEQSFALPENVDRQGIGAKVSNGVLNVFLPKKNADVEKETWQEVEVE